MPSRIEDYALIGDTRPRPWSAATARSTGCALPRFDSGACFAALLGGPEHGRWLHRPRRARSGGRARRYRGDTLVLETEYETDDGAVRSSTACRCTRTAAPTSSASSRAVAARVRDAHGAGHPLRLRLDRAWVRRDRRRHPARSPARTRCVAADARRRCAARTSPPSPSSPCGEGERVPFVADLAPLARSGAARRIDAERRDRATPSDWWREWSARCTYRRAMARRGRALADHPQGADLRADRRHRRRRRRRRCPSSSAACATGTTAICWLRDATFTLYALMMAGYHEEAARLARVAAARRRRQARRRCRSCTASPASGGCTELELPWLPGYEGARRCASATPRTRAVPARRLRRGDGRAARRAPRRASTADATLARCSARCWSSSRPTGASPTRASGRCAARAGTSPTRR